MTIADHSAFPAVALFAVSVFLTVASLWIGGRLTPWFLGQAVEPPSLRSYFLDPMSDADLNRVRLTTLTLAAAVLLAALLAIAVAVRIGGVRLV